MSTWDLLIEGDQLEEVAKERANEFIEDRVDNAILETKLKEGWLIKKEYKKTTIIKKPKPFCDVFENKVWSVFKGLGFKVMNLNNNFKLSYSDDNPNLTKQIDVIAIDDDVCLFVECKATETIDKSSSWKNEIESMQGYFQGITREIRKKYPNVKTKMIFATKNYVLGKQDLDRLADAKIAYFDNDTVDYYAQLVEHLGTAGRYQLLGMLFPKDEIKNLNMDVPAIRSKMGGLTYYTFNIEPEKLLKIAYILHRNNANHDNMPTYQRLIKKDRLLAIREFVNNGGYFPNSLIISLDVKESDLRFDFVDKKCEDTKSKLGILKLPRRYQTAYVIDGQHRLYGYSESKYAGNNSIPVVAFVNLAKEKQLELFMEINQNQKAVPLALRNTLSIDLLWKSDKAAERRTALVLSLAIKLGEDKKSPLYNRVITGENTSTDIRVVTIEYLKKALLSTGFFNEYKKNSDTIIKPGYFDKNNNDETSALLYPFLIKCLSFVETYCSEEWNKNSKGYLTINNTIYALIRIFGVIVDLVMTKKNQTIVTDVDQLFKDCENYLLLLCEAINDLAPEEIEKIKKAKGEAAKPISAFAIMYAMNQKDESFINDEMQRYFDDNYADYSSDVYYKLKTLFAYFLDKAKDQITSQPNWFTEVLSSKLMEEIAKQEAVDALHNAKKDDRWDYIDMRRLLDIATTGVNWSKFMKRAKKG